MTRSAFAHRRGVNLLLVSDSFNRTDSTTNLGSTDSSGALGSLTWTQYAGEGLGGTPPGFGISSNQAYTPAGTGKPRSPIAAVDVGTGDIDMQVKIVARSNQCALIYRFSDVNNYIAILSWSSSPQIWWYKRIAGTSFNTIHQFFSPGPAAFSNGDIVRIVANGGTHSLYLAGSLLLTVTGEAFNQGATQHGLLTQNEFTPNNGGDSGVLFDDFKIYKA